MANWRSISRPTTRSKPGGSSGFSALRLPETVQSGWEKYWNFSWHFFDLPDPARREEFAEKTRAMRVRLAIFVLVGVVVAVGVGVVAWRFTGNVYDMLRSLMAVFILPIVFLLRADRGKISGTIDVGLRVPSQTHDRCTRRCSR